MDAAGRTGAVRYPRGEERRAQLQVARERAERSRARLRVMLFLSALITYGSLYPFDFRVPQEHAGAWLQFLADWSPATSKADALGNVALFFPFGFAGAFALRPGRELSRTLSLLVASFILATAVQMAQIYVPERTAAMGDVLWNLAGTVIGVYAAIRLGKRVRFDTGAWEASQVLPAGLLGLWLVAELLPLVPSLDFGSVKSSLKALVQPTFALDQVAFHAAGAAIAGWALREILGEARWRAPYLVVLGGVAAGKVLMVTQTLDVSVLCGLVFGALCWRLGAQWRTSRREGALLAGLLLAYVVGALAPFEFTDVAQPFGWMPFETTLRGEMLANSKALVANAFLYAAVLGLIRANHASPVAASVALAILVALFDATQMYIPGRSPDITEPLVVLLVGQVLRLAPALPTARMAALPRARDAQPPGPLVSSLRFSVARALWLAAACAAMALGIALVLRLPQIPYNVAELFWRGGAATDLVIFSLALLWIGAGARLVGHWIASAARPWLVLPFAAFGAGLVSLLLLNQSVTQESIADIVGSNDLYRQVVQDGVWGSSGRELFLRFGSDELVGFFERPVRFAALYAPLVTFLALAFAAVDMRARRRLSPERVVPLAISAALWLWLCKQITFTWAATDNLTELIAEDGLPYLYALAALICVNAVLLAHLRREPLRVVAIAGLSAALLGVGWWLLNLGLEPRVNKQELGVVFSAVQFLLGPDRTNVLPAETLFLRWVLLQAAAVAVIALGARFAEPAIRELPRN